MPFNPLMALNKVVKEIVCKIDGKGAYGQLKFESGAHRVKRVPETSSR